MSKRKQSDDVVALTGNEKYAGATLIGVHNDLVVFANDDGKGFYISVKAKIGTKGRWRFYSAGLSPYGFYVRFAAGKR